MNLKPLNVAVLAFALMISASTAFCADILDEVIKLQRAGIDNDVILHFVQDSNSTNDLDAEEIQRLENAGVSSSVIVAMLDRSKELRDDPAKANAVAVNAPALPTQADEGNPTYVAESEVLAPAEGQADTSLFYEALAPYGTWSQDAGNGWVWEPTDGVRNSEWRPYANDGHWTWTNHGWYWESTSPYGWATFHYGRWGYNSHHRWSWSPDNVWGPAWVDWRHSDAYIGWAPLPFGSRFEAGVGFSYRGRHAGFDFHDGMEERDYAFVSSNSFLNVNLGVSFVPERRRHEVYSETKIINNTYVYNDNRIINNGVPVAVVSRETKRHIEPVNVVDARIAAGQPIRGERRNNNTIAAYRPKIEAKASVEPPAIVERRKLAASNRKPVEQRTEVSAKPVARETAAVQRKDNAEAERQARQRLIEEKQKRANGKQVENKQNADERRNANQDIAKERKADAVTKKDAQEKVREDAAEARKGAGAAEREVKAREAQAATTERKDARDAVKEAKDKAQDESNSAAAKQAEERRNANESAAVARKSNAEAEAKVRADAAKERKDNAADVKEVKEKARDDKREERKDKRDEKNNGKDK